jgi:hypothetical protein
MATAGAADPAHNAGLITSDEYARKRAQIVDEI